MNMQNSKKPFYQQYFHTRNARIQNESHLPLLSKWQMLKFTWLNVSKNPSSKKVADLIVLNSRKYEAHMTLKGVLKSGSEQTLINQTYLRF